MPAFVHAFLASSGDETRHKQALSREAAGHRKLAVATGIGKCEPAVFTLSDNQYVPL